MQTQNLPAVVIVDRGDLVGNAESFARHLRASNLSPRTIQTYMEAVGAFTRFLAAKGMPANIAAIKRDHIETWIEHLVNTSKPATAVNRYRSLQQFFKWAVDEGEIPVSPMAKMRAPKIPRDMIAVPTDDDMRRLLATCDGPTFEDRRDFAILRTFLDSGARLAEMTGLRWTPNDPEIQDVDLDAQTITVYGKGRRHRTTFIDAKAAKAIDRYLRLRKRHAHADSPMLWLGERGPLTTSGIFQMVARHATEAGMPGLHPHIFRHYYGHTRMAGGMSEGDLMDQAGWHSRDMLSRYASSTAAARGIAAARRLRIGDKL
jgi:site-specific recombinase XerD